MSEEQNSLRLTTLFHKAYEGNFMEWHLSVSLHLSSLQPIWAFLKALQDSMSRNLLSNCFCNPHNLICPCSKNEQLDRKGTKRRYAVGDRV